MKNVSFIQHEKLTNVTGRIKYISDERKQENLYAVYETVPRQYWKELAKENQEDFRRSGTSGKCIEARELIIALPPEMKQYDSDELLRYFTESYRKKYGAECIAALHHNKTKTNYHIHLIYSERQQLEEPIRKIASRNMYFDPEGKHVRTKKEATADGKLLPGYTMIPKGEVYEDALVEKQLIYVEPTKVKTRDGGVRNGNLLYTIRPLNDALEYHLEQQLRNYAHQGTSPV